MTLNRREVRAQQRLLSKSYLHYKDALIRYGLFKTHNGPLAEDLMQNTFLKTWKYLLKGGKVDMIEAFLYHILKALIIDEYRKHKVRSLDILIEKGFDLAFTDAERLANIFDGTKAVALLKKLPPSYREIMYMRYIQDLSIKEISRLTGKTKNTVAVQTHRGLQKLKILYAYEVKKRAVQKPPVSSKSKDVVIKRRS